MVVTWSFALHYNIKWCCCDPMLLDEQLQFLNICRGQFSREAIIAHLCRYNAVITQRALHRFLSRPCAYNPDGDAGRLHRRGYEYHLLQVVVFAIEAERLSAP